MKKQLTSEESQALLEKLSLRFEKNMSRHADIAWNDVQAKLVKHGEKLWSLHAMESSEGEPDVVGIDTKTKQFVFMDCAAESPKGRRSLCYDQAAWEGRKENKPKGSAQAMAHEMGIAMLTEEQYAYLQTLGSFDAKTSSWLATPAEVRKLGGAIFGDFRFGRVFTYHNGADSYYAARGFRGVLFV